MPCLQERRRDGSSLRVSADALLQAWHHTYDHMLFEYRMAWPHLRAGGILLSDDTDWNAAFAEFAAAVQSSPVMFNFRVGAIRKAQHLDPLPSGERDG